MRRVLLGLVIALLAATLPANAAPAATKAKVKCHWVKATKKRKRHKVCVKVKATKKKTAKGTGSTPSSPAKGTTTAPSSTHKPSTTSTSSAPASSSAPATPSPAPDTTTPAPSPPTAPDPAPAAARLQATTREWSITLSRPSVTAGALVLQLVNRGEDAHDLHLRPAAGGADLLAIASTEPGDVADASGTLAAGAYTLYCALPGHEAAGMRATLTVQ